MSVDFPITKEEYKAKKVFGRMIKSISWKATNLTFHKIEPQYDNSHETYYRGEYYENGTIKFSDGTIKNYGYDLELFLITVLKQNLTLENSALVEKIKRIRQLGTKSEMEKELITLQKELC